MKDYKKMFDEKNKKDLEQYKLWKWYWKYSSIITVIITVVLVIFLARFRSAIHSFPMGTILLVMICLCIVSTIAKARLDFYRKQLEEKAKTFVSLTIFTDICSTLESVGTFDSDFKSTLRNIIKDDRIWFKKGQFVCKGFNLDYKNDKERLMIENEGCTYYLTSWWHSYGLTFMFTFDKIKPNGRVEKDVKFSLKAKEPMFQ